MSSAGMPSVMQTIERDARVGRLQDGVRRERGRHVDDAACWRRWPRRPRARCRRSAHCPPPSRRPCPASRPPRRCVPYAIICSVWKAPSRPVMPWTTRRVSLSTRMLMFSSLAHARSARSRCAPHGLSAPPPPASRRCAIFASARIARPSSSFVPTRRTTIGTSVGTSLERLQDAPRHLVAARDAAEDVEQHGLRRSDRRG